MQVIYVWKDTAILITSGLPSDKIICGGYESWTEASEGPPHGSLSESPVYRQLAIHILQDLYFCKKLWPEAIEAVVVVIVW